MNKFHDAHSMEKASVEFREMIDYAGVGLVSWSDIVERLQRFYPGSVWWIINQSRQDNGSNFIVSAGMPEDMINKYYEHYGALNPWLHSWEMRKQGESAVSERDDPIKLQMKSEYYNDFLMKLGDVDAACGIKLGSRQQHNAFMGMHYPLRRDDDYGLSGEKLMQELYGAFNRAVDTNRMLRDTTMTIAANAALVDRHPDCALVLHSDFRIADSNANGLEMLRLNEVLSEKGGRFQFNDSDTQSWLRQTIGAMASHKPVARNERIWEKGGNRYAVWVSPVRIDYGQMSFAFKIHSLFLLTVRRLNLIDHAPLAKAFSQYFRLTPAEEILCNHLAAGRDLAECQKALGISRETARSRLKGIFHKTGTRRQAELVALLIRSN